MRKLVPSALGAALALVGVATALAGPAAKEKVIGQDSASGVNATAIADGDAKSPKALYVAVDASPAQSIQVDWYVVCNYPAFEVQDRKGSFTAQPPFRKKIPFPKKKPLKCGLSVSASIAEGDVNLTLLAR